MACQRSAGEVVAAASHRHGTVVGGTWLHDASDTVDTLAEDSGAELEPATVAVADTVAVAESELEMLLA